MLVLAKHANEDFEAWPSGSTIAMLTRISRRYVVKILKKLEKEKEIERVGKSKNGVIVYRIICGLGFTDQIETSANNRSHSPNKSRECQFTSTCEPECARPVKTSSHKDKKNNNSEKGTDTDIGQADIPTACGRWRECRSAMEEAFEITTFESWLRDAIVESDDGEEITLIVPTRLYRDFITENLLPEIQRILHRKVKLIVASIATKT